MRPGGEILLRVDNWPKVERVLQAIDAVEALDVDPADAAPEHWRVVVAAGALQQVDGHGAATGGPDRNPVGLD
ncbi:DUF2840 domain-containing protein, partial [Vibrio parahaemolyticus]|nr:DUF2840 domain-containing protein [Vibrio parahaemolyticus]